MLQIGNIKTIASVPICLFPIRNLNLIISKHVLWKSAKIETEPTKHGNIDR